MVQDFESQKKLLDILVNKILNSYSNEKRHKNFASEKPFVVIYKQHWKMNENNGNSCILTFYLERKFINKRLFSVTLLFSLKAGLVVVIKHYTDEEFLNKFTMASNVKNMVFYHLNSDVSAIELVEKITGKEASVNIHEDF